MVEETTPEGWVWDVIDGCKEDPESSYGWTFTGYNWRFWTDGGGAVAHGWAETVDEAKAAAQAAVEAKRAGTLYDYHEA